MANEPSILDVADEEFAKINKPEQKQEQGSILDIADDEFKKQEEESTQKEFDVAKLEKLKAEGKPLSEVQQRMIFDEKDKVPLLEQAAIGLEKFIPAAAVKVGELSRGAYELAREGVVKPVYVGTKYHLGLATPKETNIAARGAEIAGRSAVSGVASDIEDTSNLATRGIMYGTTFTDKLQGLSADERFKRYRLREDMRGIEQAWREETPDRAAALLAENVLLQKAAGIAAKLQGGTEEDAKEAEKAYSELVLESGLTREELNPYISAIGEVVSPISIPGANIATKTIGKYTGKAVQKGGELALKGVVKPIATGVEKSAEFIEKGITGVQTGARKLGEYVTGDPDTLIRGGSIAGLIQAPQITGMILAAKPATIATKEIARTVKDIASAVDVGGAAGIRGLVERGGAKPNAGALTKRLFSAESRGGLGRARAADWMIRQGNAITQQGVNGAVLNTILGLPDIESIEQGFEAAGSGFGIGAFTGSRIMERAGAVIDPRTGLAQKIDTIITPDPSSRRADEDADIKRFLSSVDPNLVPKMEKLGSIDERKKAIQSKVDALEKQKNVTFGPEVELIKKEIIRQKQNIEKLDKSTPQTQKEILRQIHLAFADEMDLAKTTGKAAGLNNIQVKILDPSEMEGFYRNSYGTTLTDAESVVASLTGKPDLTPEETQSLKNARTVVDGFFREVAGSQSTRGFAVSEGSDSDGNPLPEFMRKQNLQGATIVINGDLVKQLSDEGFNIRNVVGHEMHHALERFTEVRDMLAPIRKDLFDQKTIEPDGTVKKITSGIYSDDKLDSYAGVYAASMSPSDGGKSFKEQFGDDKEKLRAYIKEEVLSELSGRSGNVNAGTRAALDSIGRQAVDWLEVKTQNGALKKIKETLRKSGIIFDDNGTVSTILGAELTPESLAMIRQYKRQLKNLNQSMVYETGTRKEEVDVPIERIMADRSLQEKTKDIDLFQKEQVAVVTAPDGSKQEIPIPPDTGVDSFVGKYNIQEGQLVDESGSPINLGPIEFGTVPNGTQVEIQSVISRDSDGVPKALTLRKAEQISRERGKTIKDALDSAMQKGALQMEDMGNGHYRGTMSEAQVSAILALPNTIVSPELKREILFVNEILRRRDGTRIRFEYFPTTKGGKPNSISMQIRDEIPIGFHFSKKFNFFKTTISVTRMMEKLNAWVAKNPENLKLWNGDTSSFWDDLTKVLANHASGERGEYQLDDDVSVAIEKKNAINDLFNVYNAETKAANPRRTKLPRQKGKDPLDIIVRSRRMDRIGQYIESDEQKLPFNYELNTRNYMPAENPLAGFQTPEDFASDIPSVTAEEIRGAINTGNLDQVEAKLRETDDLKPAESLDEENGNIRIVSMFDNQFMPEEPMESEPEVSASATQFMPAETERYPTSERGMYSGLQKTIDQKVQGKFASPDQLKAIVTNPQNAKAEELKWSGVLGEIDRLAAENQGKVPKDKVMDYLRNEGAVKFEEVTLGGKEAFDQNRLNQLEAEYRNLKDHPIDDPSFGEDKYDELIKLMNIRDQSTTDTLYSEAESVMKLAQQAQRRGDKKTAEKYFRENEFLNTRAEKLDLQGQGLANPPRFAGLQLPGGANYREVVLSMPEKYTPSYLISKLDGTGIIKTFDTAKEAEDFYNNLENKLEYEIQSFIQPKDRPFQSSHFPEVPNYVAHMRINERTDAQGNEGLFVEEFQSDRHQAGREKGYREDFKPLSEEEKKRLDIARNEVEQLEEQGAEENPTPEYQALYSEVLDLMQRNQGGSIDSPPDAPFRKDWSIQLFKRALRDAVDSDKKWIGWTTGIEQVKRYEQAMRQAVDEITWNTPKGYQKAFAAIKDGNTILTGKINDDGTVYDFSYDSNFAEAGADANGKQLSEVLGKEVASKILAENSGTAAGDDLTVGGEGMKGFYDTILPKEIGKYVAKMGGKVEKSEITTQKESTWTQVTRTRNAVPKTKISPAKTTPIWRVDITPEMAGKVRGGQLQFMPAEQPTEYEPISARIRPLEGISAPTKVVGAKALSLGEIEPPVRGKAMLPDMELKPDISEKGIQSSDKTGLQFMPAEGEEKIKISPKIDTKYLAAIERSDMETAQRMVDEAERIEAENNFEVEYGSKIFGEYPQASKVIKRLDGTLKDHVPVPVAMLQTGINGNKYYVRALMVKDDNGIFYGFYNDRKERTQVIRNSFENFGVWDDPLARDSYLEIAELIAKKAKYPAKKAKFKDFAIDWWATQGDIQPTAKLKDFIEWEFLDDEIGEVKVRRGTPTAGWNKAATKAGYQHLPIAKFKDGTEIIINTGDKSLFTHPSDLFASLIHEAVHLIQAKEGRFYKSLGDDPNYYSNNIEKEARDAVATIPLLEWAENNLGDYIPGKSNINHPHSIPPAASPVTYDDAGNVIPLSQRFQTTSSDLPRATGLQFMPAEGERPTKNMPQSALNVLYADSKDLPKPDKKITNAKVALALADIAERTFGGKITSSTITPEIIEDFALNGANEAEAALKSSGKNAANWYSTAIKAALAVAGTIHKALSDIKVAKQNQFFAKEYDPVRAAQFALRLPLAITSQNVNVPLNTEYAELQFNHFQETGKFDIKQKHGSKAPAISSNLNLANVMIDKLGSILALEDFVKKEFTVRDLEIAASKIAGKKITISGLKDDIVNGAAIFGPKIGQGFLQNLMGKFDPVTIDLWMRRTWGRWTGDVVGDGVTGQRLARIIEEYKNSKRVLPDFLKDIKTEMRSLGTKSNGDPTKPELTISEDIESKIESDSDFRKGIEQFSKEANAEFQIYYKLMGEPMTKKSIDNLVGSIQKANETQDADESKSILSTAYNKLISDQSKIKSQLDSEWSQLTPAQKKELNKQDPTKAISKEKWKADQHILAKRTEKLENEQKNIIKPKWANAAKSIIADLNPIDIPSDIDRKVITIVVNKIRQHLEERGYDVTNADVQAILWYPEKDLWAKLRGEEESNLKQSYDDEFLKIAEERGVGKEARRVAKEIRGY